MAFVSSFLPVARPSPVSTLCARRTTRPRHASPTMTATQLTQYDSLRAITTIVEDTGEIETIRAHRPYAATTNPSLVAAAAAKPEYGHLLEEAVQYGRQHAIAGSDTLAIVRNKLFTLFGAEILKYIPGDVSTEVDARLSFDVAAQVEVAQQIIKMYDEVGVGRERVLIKLATTWEGVQACRQLEKMGIKTNMTLLFSLAQAAAAAEAGAYLISPFVGRILDWYKKAEGRDSYPANEDPGVKSVKQIYNYYKCMGYETIVMGASFRNKGEILELAGCDRLTIAPKFINSLKDTPESVETKLSKPGAEQCNVIPRLTLDEPQFRWMMNEDAMATEKLAHGIRGFARDLEKLDKQLQGMMNA
eukprot:TRINITY_DN1230_c1_g1_i1.p4 TRINITY_DN1230_c1_g1~~TRINITY_DN1230_c1_g1_i1.p4  ORF type:complete len:360 (-),score=78.03 TRINITY_DN1230_c1_g1_i1:9295-10374(-)